MSFLSQPEMFGTAEGEQGNYKQIYVVVKHQLWLITRIQKI